MRQRNRHNPDNKGLLSKNGRLSKLMRRPVTLMSGLIMLTGIGSERSTHDKKLDNRNYTTETMDKTAFTSVDAMDALLVAHYGEKYNRGMYPELDVVVDTAKTSKGLQSGVDELLGDKLDENFLYAKRLIKDRTLAEDLYQKAYASLRADVLGTRPSSAQLAKPLKNIRITSGFGARHVRGAARASRNHKGVDFGARPGTEVMAVMRSKMVSSQVDHKNNIAYVVMDGVDERGNKNGWRFRYFHVRLANKGLNKIYEAGQPVTTIARHHEYGHETSTGPHLHFEIQRWNSRTGKYELVNPEAVARNNFVLPGYRPAPTLPTKVGSYIASVIKSDKDGNGFVGVEQQIAADYAAGKISAKEYQQRKQGLDIAVNELRARGLDIFKQDYQDQAEKLVKYTSRIMDGDPHSQQKHEERKRNINRPYSPIFAMNSTSIMNPVSINPAFAGTDLFLGNFAEMATVFDKQTSKNPLRAKVVDKYMVNNQDMVAAVYPVQAMPFTFKPPVSKQQAMLIPNGV